MLPNFIGKVKIQLPNYKSELLPKDIASAEPIKVEKYEDLVTEISKIAFDNPHLNLYFRGQTEDHKALKPQACREDKCTFLDKYWLFLIGPCYRKIYFEKVLPEFSNNFLGKLRKKLGISSRQHKFIGRFNESKWAIVQHYGYPTPLLDVTKSIRAAASFATKIYKPDSTEAKDNPKPGFVYVLGFPEIRGYISYFTYEAIVITRLLGTCPPQAKRPHFQDGYLVGTIPHETSEITDFNNCLVAKFRIDKPPQEFWNDKIKPMDINEIYPKDDKVKGIADSMENDFRTLCKKEWSVGF